MKKIKSSVSRPEYPTLHEYQSKKAMHLAALVGLGVVTVSAPLDLNAGEKQKPQAGKTAKKDNAKIKEKILLLAADLGHDEFKKREQATKSLILLGKNFETNKNSEMTSFLETVLQKSKKSKDPEVKERAKRVLIAITPPPKKLRNQEVRMAGVMIE